MTGVQTCALPIFPRGVGVGRRLHAGVDDEAEGLAGVVEGDDAVDQHEVEQGRAGRILGGLGDGGLDAVDGAFSTLYAMKDLSYALMMADEAGLEVAGARLAMKRFGEIDATSSPDALRVAAKLSRPA